MMGPPPPSPMEAELSMKLDEASSQIEKLKQELKEIKDENRALHIAVGDENRLSDAAKRLYDNAGRDPGNVQKIPDEMQTDVEIPQEQIASLLGNLSSLIE